MAKVIADLQVEEVKVNNLNCDSYDSSQVALKYLKEKVFKKHNIDSARFVNSFEYYTKNNGEIIKIYEDAIKILTPQNKKKP